MRLSSIKLELEQPPRKPSLQAAELVGCWLKLGRPGCAIFSNAQRSRGLPRPSGMVNERRLQGIGTSDEHVPLDPVIESFN